MRARTASSFSTSKTPQGLRLGNGIRPVHPDTLSPAIFPSLPRLHHTRDRSDRFESPPRLLLLNSPLDTPPHHHYHHHLRRTRPADHTHNRIPKPSHSFVYRLLRFPRVLTSPSETFFPVRSVFTISERPGAPAFPNLSMACFHVRFPFFVGVSVHLVFYP